MDGDRDGGAAIGLGGSVLRLLEVQDRNLPVFSPEVVGFRFEREVVRPLRAGAPPGDSARRVIHARPSPYEGS